MWEGGYPSSPSFTSSRTYACEAPIMRNRAAGAILAAVLLGVAAPSLAQPPAGKPPAPPAAQADPAARARERFTEGVQLAKKKDWARAYEAFVEAWTLKQHPQIALNLGRAELELGKHRPAAEHLRYCIDQSPAGDADAKLARDWLVEAKTRVVTLTVTVEGTGVEVRIDGKPVGASPLPAEIYLDPGKHTVEARSGAARDEVAGEYQAGESRAVKLVPREPAAAALTTPEPPPVQPPQDRPSPARTVVLASGGAVALAGIVIGIAGVAAAAGKLGERDALCAGAACPREGDAGYETTRSTWQGLEADRISLLGMGIVGFIAGGVAAAGTGVAFFVWKPSPATTGTAGALRAITVAPAGAGLAVTANW
jgi:hypothetical protein